MEMRKVEVWEVIGEEGEMMMTVTLTAMLGWLSWEAGCTYFILCSGTH